MNLKQKNMLKMLVKIAITCLIILFIVFIINNFRKEHFQDKECTGNEQQKVVCCSNHLKDNSGMKIAILNTDGNCELKDVEECPADSEIINIDVGESDVDLVEPLTCDELKEFIEEFKKKYELTAHLGKSSIVDITDDCSNLYIQNTQMDDDVVELAKALKGNTTLTELSLNNNNIDDDGASALADALKGNNTLEYLDLSENNIGDDGASALADALQINNTLEYLDLTENNIGDDGANDLADALKGNNTLIWLDLNNNNIVDTGVSALRPTFVAPSYRFASVEPESAG